MLGIARAWNDVLRIERVPTTTPEATLRRTVAFFEEAAAKFGRFDAAGIGSFGPADVDPRPHDWAASCRRSSPA